MSTAAAVTSASTLDLRAGETLGIAGPSGAGKTTLLNLLARFYDPVRGAVRLDGRDLRELRLSDVYRQIAIVAQDPFLFAASVRENIRCGRPDATDEEVEAAARAAEIHDDVLAMPGELDREPVVRAAVLTRQKPLHDGPRPQIEALPRIAYTVKHHCVEGWSAIAIWTGTPLRTIAELAGVHPDARYVRFDSFDADYYNGWDMKSAMHPETILAYGFNDHFLTPEHGAPLRLYAPHKLGYKLTKYLTRIAFTAERPGGYWEDRGYPWFAGV